MEFIYEKLDVWKKAVDFAMKVTALSADKSEDRNAALVIAAAGKSAMTASTAIAKGKAYASKNDFVQHLYLSRGSVYETMTLLEILKRKQTISDDQYTEFETMGNQVTAMVSGLIKYIFKPPEKPNSKRDNKTEK